MHPRAIAVAVGLAVLAGSFSAASADTPGAQGVVLTGMRSWSAPADTRVVFEFSHTVTAVAPDSGRSRQVVLSLPGELVSRAPSVPGILGVRDGVVDSVEVATTVRSEERRVGTGVG